MKPTIREYTSKLPAAVNNAMCIFTGGKPYLVKRSTQGDTATLRMKNCHTNVQHLVEQKGGERIPCWLHQRLPMFTDAGIWVWAFHSVWKKPDGTVVDPTDDPFYTNKDYKLVWFETHRDVDLIDGTSVNNVVVFENSRGTTWAAQYTGTHTEVGQAYWTTPALKAVLPIENHSGVYRWVNNDYPDNIKRMESEYDCKVEGTKLRGNCEGALIDARILFDYSLSGH